MKGVIIIPRATDVVIILKPIPWYFFGKVAVTITNIIIEVPVVPTADIVLHNINIYTSDA